MKSKLEFIVFALIFFGLIGCSSQSEQEGTEEDPQAEESTAAENPTESSSHNQLTEAEKQEGWKLLFNGKNLEGWHRYNGEGVGKKWQVEDGTLTFLGKDSDLPPSEGGTIVTDNVYDNYELSLEWKISPAGNSGIIYNIIEDEKYDNAYMTSPEMQVLDNDAHPDGQIEKHRSGDLYDLIACSEETVKPAGEWNHVRLVINGDQVEHWLNGVKVVEYEWNSEELQQLIQNSKWKDYPDFASADKGRIGLQDHSDRVWFRNIKIREF